MFSYLIILFYFLVFSCFRVAEELGAGTQHDLLYSSNDLNVVLVIDQGTGLMAGLQAWSEGGKTLRLAIS